MSEKPAYVIAHLPEIHDPKVYRRYERRFYIMVKRYGGDVLTFDDNSHHFEGDSPLSGRVILMRFLSAEAAKACYADPRYQEIAVHRRASAVTGFVSLLCGSPLQKSASNL